MEENCHEDFRAKDDDKAFRSKTTAYLEDVLFPIIGPALENVLRQAEKEKCFIRKHTKYCPFENFVEHLFRHLNANQTKLTPFKDIPQVEEIYKNLALEIPEKNLPNYLIWTEFEAILIIQSFWRGFQVRQEKEVRDLRNWHKKWRDMNEEKRRKFSIFKPIVIDSGDINNFETEDELMEEKSCITIL